MTKLKVLLIGALAVAAVAACERGGPTGESRPRGGVSSPSAEPDPGAAAEIQDGEPERVAEEPWQRYAFDGETAGSTPQGFTPVHSGSGAPGRWQVVEALDLPSGRQGVAQIDADRTNSRFPLLVLDAIVAHDVELRVAGKPISGTRDQAFGLIWRYQDPDNYYVVRANALEDNVVLYKMEEGRRSDLDLKGRGRTYGLDVEVPSGTWSRLEVRVRGHLFIALLDGRELFQVEDDTFAGSGRVGLWTKADSVTWFDNFEVRVLHTVGSAEPEEEASGD